MESQARTVAGCIVAAALVCILNWPSHASGQVTVQKAVDIDAGIKAGTVQAAIIPSSGADSLRIFDGNQASDYLLAGVHNLSITLTLSEPLPISRSKLYCYSIGFYTLELAGTMADLDSKTGTYVRVANLRRYKYMQWDSVNVPAGDYAAIRLSAVDTSARPFFQLGEWGFLAGVTYTHLTLSQVNGDSSALKIVSGESMKPSVCTIDTKGVIRPYDLSYPLEYSTSDSTIATIDLNGVVTGKLEGAASLGVTTLPPSLSGSASVNVVKDFSSPRVAPMRRKVALVVFDPVIPAYDMRVHVKFGWRDPMALTSSLVKHFLESSDSVASFVIDTVIDCQTMYTYVNDSLLSLSTYVAWLQEPGWTTLHAYEKSGSYRFDYVGCVKDLQLDSLRNAGRIDEVWGFAGPFMGMYESQLMGPGAFWWNSPPIAGGTSLTRLLSVMGLNYERGVDQAFHSFAHRMESAMSHAYWEVTGQSWNSASATPTAWDLFTRTNKDVPGGAHVGNCHFPPNGTSDYNYGNVTWVNSYAQNWHRYPYLYSGSAPVNVTTWLYKGSEPLAEGYDHLGYLRWFYNHVPRYEGITDGVLNNWWHYALDYEGAVALARGLTGVSTGRAGGGLVPAEYIPIGNYPNPFNPQTTIRFVLPAREHVRLDVCDLLGREVALLADGMLDPGEHRVRWDATRAAAGPYFYRLQTTHAVRTGKMLLMK
jgi:hypothetical protein